MPSINATVVASVNRPWLLSLRGDAEHNYRPGHPRVYRDLHHSLTKAGFTMGDSVVIVSHQEYFQMADDLAKIKSDLENLKKAPNE